MVILTANFPMQALGHLGKERIVRGTTTKLAGIRALLPELEQVVPIYSLLEQCGRLPRNDLTLVLVYRGVKLIL